MQKKTYSRLYRHNKAHYLFFLFRCFFVTLVAVCCLCTSCVRPELFAKRNPMLGKLSEPSQDAYLALMYLLKNDEAAKEKLEKRVNEIKTEAALSRFITLHLLYQKLYEALRKVLPKTQASELKNAVNHCTNQDQRDTLIIENFPQSLQHLDETTQENLIKLSNNELQDVLIAARKKEGPPIRPNVAAASGANDSANGLVTKQSPKKEADTSTNTLDIKQLINQKAKATQKTDTFEEKDDWGPKLPLKGPRREAFFRLIMPFSQVDQKALKGLLTRSNAGSIENFLNVYDTEFNLDDRIMLLETLIYLYKGWPALCMKMCNDPESLGICDKLGLVRKLDSSTKVALLTRLSDVLSG